MHFCFYTKKIDDIRLDWLHLNSTFPNSFMQTCEEMFDFIQSKRRYAMPWLQHHFQGIYVAMQLDAERHVIASVDLHDPPYIMSRYGKHFW